MPANSVTVFVRPNRVDTRRLIEYSCSQQPVLKLKSNLLALLAAVLCFAVSAVLHASGKDDASVMCFAVSVAVATYAVVIGLAKFITFRYSLRVLRRNKESMLAKLESDPQPDIVKSFVFDSECCTVSLERECASIPYGEFRLAEEHSDCFIFEAAGVLQTIPSRFVSAEDYLALTAILKEHCPTYRVAEPMRTPDRAEQVELPVLPAPAAVAEYTLTDGEKAQVIGQSPSCYPESSPSRIKEITRSRLSSCGEMRAVLYPDCLVLGIAGQNLRYFYGEIGRAEDIGEFILISFNNDVWVFPVPVRVLEDKDAFLHILRSGMEADSEGALQAELQRLEREDTPVIEEADMTVGRTLLRARFDGKDILYRRRFGVTELIIDESVYDRSKKLIERAHHLTAWVDGIEYSAMMNAADQHSYLTAGSRILGKKIRMI